MNLGAASFSQDACPYWKRKNLQVRAPSPGSSFGHWPLGGSGILQAVRIVLKVKSSPKNQFRPPKSSLSVGKTPSFVGWSPNVLETQELVVEIRNLLVVSTPNFCEFFHQVPTIWEDGQKGCSLRRRWEVSDWSRMILAPKKMGR